MLNGSSKSPDTKKASTDGRRSTRGKSSAARSESPTKKTPGRKIATPRKPRKGRGKSAEPDTAVNGEVEKQETVKVEVETQRLPSPDGDEEIERTKVNVEMPASHPDLELPDNAEEMLEKAREMVAEANSVGGARPKSPKGKRKAADALDAEDGEGSAQPVVKRAKKAELEIRKERIKRRALTGIVASLAIGAMIPNIIAAFGS